jgi:hypothetical protein
LSFFFMQCVQYLCWQQGSDKLTANCEMVYKIYVDFALFVFPKYRN